MTRRRNAVPDATGWQNAFRRWAVAPLADSPLPLQVLEDSLLPVALARIAGANSARPILIIAPQDASLEQNSQLLANFLEILGDPRPVIPLPSIAPNRATWIPENEAGRSAALETALAGTPAIFLTTPVVLIAETMAPRTFQSQKICLKKGTVISPDALAEKLVEMDYDHEVQVTQPGEFSRRGGIFDIFSPLYEAPVRLEFFGDEIDTLRFFHPDTQRSYLETGECQVIPRGMAILQKQQRQTAHICDFFPKDILTVFINPMEIATHVSGFLETPQIRLWNKVQKGFSPQIALVSHPGELPGGSRMLDIHSLSSDLAHAIPSLGREAALWHWQQLKTAIQNWKEQGYSVVACCSEEGEIDRFRQLMAENGELPLQIVCQPIGEGLIFPQARLALLSSRELFGRREQRRRCRQVNYENQASLSDELALEEGNYVVHVTHGIGIYHGVHTLENGTELQEVMELEFADNARLYVPMEQAYLVSRYLGAGKAMPKLNKLGSGSWERATEKASSAAMDLAAELLKTEAMRENSKAARFSPMPDWENSFAHSFPWTETPDQAAAIRAVLQDMESPRPMDRLLCGDVGYGKTEVAMRAAFRAVVNGYQVAVLVPTTILAQQHYQSFRERMAEYPVTLDVLSRFRTPSEIRSIRERAATGELDILIGTHAILSRTLHFRKLGLLVIDEEQRFGVKHKQMLKKMRAGIDILTMSATPIPRTLYFSLSGIRHLSTIQTPPRNRLPVSTIVANFNEETIRTAITRELARKGQVFFLYNRIETIDKVAELVRRLVPSARCEVAHSQMGAEKLEELMTRFVRQEFDVLVCTTIIESGLDIPNVNTILIDRADRFGLSELYQLRGRVGRTDRQAYAYMLLPSVGSLTGDARQRMAAIRRYTHLGAGFRLALRDLEIRGAGNILGAEQSGHIAAVGFEMYCQLLKHAVSRLASQTPDTTPKCAIHFDQLVFALKTSSGRTPLGLDREYIPDITARIGFHRKLENCTTPGEILDIAAEMKDRFGPLPPATAQLMEYHRLRLLAISQNIRSVSVIDRKLLLETPRGLLRDAHAQLPALHARDGAAQVQEVIRFLQQMPRL